jgi:hypothetical protein
VSGESHAAAVARAFGNGNKLLNQWVHEHSRKVRSSVRGTLVLGHSYAVPPDEAPIPSTQRPFIDTWVDVTLARGLLKSKGAWVGRAKLFEILRSLAEHPPLEFNEATVVSRLEQLSRSEVIDVTRQSGGDEIARLRIAPGGREALLRLLQDAEARYRASQ